MRRLGSKSDARSAGFEKSVGIRQLPTETRVCPRAGVPLPRRRATKAVTSGDRPSNYWRRLSRLAPRTADMGTPTMSRTVRRTRRPHLLHADALGPFVRREENISGDPIGSQPVASALTLEETACFLG